MDRVIDFESVGSEFESRRGLYLFNHGTDRNVVMCAPTPRMARPPFCRASESPAAFGFVGGMAFARSEGAFCHLCYNYLILLLMRGP
jgi:hypothetical protein